MVVSATITASVGHWCFQ